MSVDERMRHEMYSGLEDKLGTSVADALMAHLPPTGWVDVARQDHVSALRTDMAGQLSALRTDMDVLRTDLGALGTALRVEMVGLEARLGLLMDAKIHQGINRLLYFMIPTVFSAVGLSFAAARL